MRVGESKLALEQNDGHTGFKQLVAQGLGGGCVTAVIDTYGVAGGCRLATDRRADSTTAAGYQRHRLQGQVSAVFSGGTSTGRASNLWEATSTAAARNRHNHQGTP